MWWPMAVTGSAILVALGVFIFLIIKKPFLQTPNYTKKKKRLTKRKCFGYGFIVTSVLLLFAFVAICVLQYFSIVGGEEMSLKEMDEIVEDSETAIKAAKQSSSQLDFSVYDSVISNFLNSENIENYLKQQTVTFEGALTALKGYIKMHKVSDLISKYDTILEKSSSKTGCPNVFSKLELNPVWVHFLPYTADAQKYMDNNKEVTIKTGLDDINTEKKQKLINEKTKLTSFANDIVLALEKWKKSLEVLRTWLKTRVTKGETPEGLVYIIIALIYCPNGAGCLLVPFILFITIRALKEKQIYVIHENKCLTICGAIVGTVFCVYLFGGEAYIYIVDSQKEGQQCMPDTVSYDMFNYDVSQFDTSAPKINVENIMNTCKSSQSSLFSNIVSIDNTNDLQNYKDEVIAKISEYYKLWVKLNSPILSSMLTRLKENSDHLGKLPDNCMDVTERNGFKKKFDEFAKTLKDFSDKESAFKESIRSPRDFEEVKTFFQNMDDGQIKLNDLKSKINIHAKAHDHKCLPVKEISEKAANHQCAQKAIIMDSAKTIPIFVMSSSICWTIALIIMLLMIFFFSRLHSRANNLQTARSLPSDLGFDEHRNLLKWFKILQSTELATLGKHFDDNLFNFKNETAKMEAFNLKKNRPLSRHGIPCFDETRVVLKNRKHDFIHANWVNFQNSPRRYICTQGPIDRSEPKRKETYDDFWTMCYQQNVKCIVMLCCQNEEAKTKCGKYYPEKEKSVLELDNMKVVCKKISTPFESIVLRELEVSEKNSKKTPIVIHHYHVMWWPDHGVPDDAAQVIDLLDSVHKINKDISPIVVHCSAGVGRTGTLVCIDYAIEQIKKNDKVIIEDCFKYVRWRRSHAVQDRIQYLFIFTAVVKFCIIKKVATEVEAEKFFKQYDDARKVAKAEADAADKKAKEDAKKEAEEEAKKEAELKEAKKKAEPKEAKKK